MSKEALSKITEKLASRIRAWRQTGVTRTLEREATDYVEFVASELAATVGLHDRWQALDTAPIGYDGQRFHHVLFRGRSKAGSFSGLVYVSGWMDHERRPVHEYSYKLIIDAWAELPT